MAKQADVARKLYAYPVRSPLNPAKKKALLGSLVEVYEFVEQMPEERACQHCAHFADGNCSWWSAPVPADVQPNGCDRWEWLPF